MRLTDWGRLYGLNRISTWRMYNEGRLPSDLKVEKVGGILCVIVPEDKRLLTVGYARVSSSDRKHLLEGQSSRLWKYAGENGIVMDRVVEEVASGLNDRRKKLLSLLSDPDVGWLVVEHRDRLARFGVGMVDAMLRARGGGLVVAEGARDNFRAAMDRWFKGEAGRPGFHARRATGSGSFLAASGVDTIRYDGHRRLRLPYIGSVRLRHELPGDAVVSKVTVKKVNGRWYASLGLRVPDKAQEWKPQPCGGLDVGISPLAMESDGTEHENPRALRRSLGKLRRWQRAQSRRKAGSRGWHEAQGRIDSCQRRITGLRNNAHHHVSRAVTRKYSVLGVETLNVSGMDKLRWQAQAIRDAAIGGLLRKVEYKCRWYGTELVQAPAFYPSSKTCYACGVVNAELRRESVWRCGACGVTHERNLNAARNLQKLALGAVGPDVTRPDSKALVRLTTSETIGDEGRTGPLATVLPAAD